MIFCFQPFLVWIEDISIMTQNIYSKSEITYNFDRRQLATGTVPLENNFPMWIFWNILEYFRIFWNIPKYSGYYGIFRIIVIPLYSRVFQNILKYSKIFKNT